MQSNVTMTNPHEDSQPGIITEEDTTLQFPSMYKVILLNDDYTPMDFVVHILKKFFDHGETQANQIMYEVHTLGKGIAGLFPYSIAETKVHHVIQYSQKNKHPLQCTLEKDSC
jgi:ATP-dependent Clp protease adaptor protein ClpS